MFGGDCLTLGIRRRSVTSGGPKCHAKVIAEDKLERYIEAGWEIADPLGNGKIAVKKT